DGKQIPYGGAALSKLTTIDLSQLDPRLQDVRIEVACDVDNPLTGPHGASSIYGPQKGADEQEIKKLDQNLKHFSEVIQQDLGLNIENESGAGAAGGVGAAMLAFLGAELRKGGDLIVEMLALEDTIKTADFVITGEGGMNHQTIFGKAPIIVAKIAKKYNIPVIALVGSISEGYEEVYKHGIDAVFSILPEVTDLEEALNNAYRNIERTAYNVAEVLAIDL